ncbi:hypothetical protein C8R42DRAFT_595259, partial [Lentinula raphanica]
LERIYVHESVYDVSVDNYVEKVKGSYVFSGPTLPSTNLGPVVSLASAVRIRKQVEDAVLPSRPSMFSDVPCSFVQRWMS